MNKKATKIFSLVICLCFIVSNSGLCSYGVGWLHKLNDEETFREYIVTIGDNYYNLTGTRIRLDFNLLDTGDFLRAGASTYDELIENEKANLSIEQRNHPNDKQWISFVYSGAFNDIAVVQQNVEIISDEDIAELRTLAGDVETDIDTRINNLLSAIFVKLYSDLEYEETDATKEMVAVYDKLQAGLLSDKPVDATIYAIGILAVIIVIGCFCFIRREKNKNEKNNSNDMSD